MTDEIYRHLFAPSDQADSIHVSRWPAPDARFEDGVLESFGETLVTISTAVRRHKSERNLSLSTEINRLQLATADANLANLLRRAIPDIASITRARQITVVPTLEPDLEAVLSAEAIQVGLSVM